VVLFGLGLHTVGDYLPHANLSGNPTAGHQEGVNEDGSESHWNLKDADYTYKNPTKALATFERFRGLWEQYMGNSAPPRALTKAEVNLLERFIYARAGNWDQMSKALTAGIKGLGPNEEKHAEEVLELMADPEKRTKRFADLLATPSGADANKKAWTAWAATPNDDFINSNKVDISGDVAGLPQMTDPYKRPTIIHYEPRHSRHQGTVPGWPLN
jgi:hypothetical protein